MMFLHKGGTQSGSGGRRGARRLCASAAALCALLFSAPAAANEGTPQPDVTVTEAKGVYSVTARFAVRQPPAAAQAVLTDYDRIPRFMPDVRTSTVIERTADRVLVEQVAVARVMMFSKRVHLLLEVSETPGAIQFRDRSGRSFSQYEGTWLLTTDRDRTVITYQLTAKPTFDAPEFVIKRLLKRDAIRLIEGLSAEIARAAGQSAAAGGQTGIAPGSDAGQIRVSPEPR